MKPEKFMTFGPRDVHRKPHLFFEDGCWWVLSNSTISGREVGKALAFAERLNGHA